MGGPPHGEEDSLRCGRISPRRVRRSRQGVLPLLDITADPAPGRCVLEGEVIAVHSGDDPGRWIRGAIRLREDGSRIVFVGTGLPGIEVGWAVSLRGYFEVHPCFGEQFRVVEAQAMLPAAREAVIRYISANVAGCGAAKSGRIVDVLGPDCLEQLQREPRLIATLFRGREADQQVAAWKSWAEDRENNAAAHRLQFRFASAGISLGLAQRIVRFFRSAEVAEIVATREPYRLMDVPGIGWVTADRVASEMGIPDDNPARLDAAVLHVLEQARGQGHSALPRAEAIRRAQRLLSPRAPTDLADALLRCEEACTIVLDHSLCFLPDALYAEWDTARSLAALLRSARTLDRTERGAIAAVIERSSLSREQADAVWMVVENGVSLLTGRPGSGKTTTLRVVTECCAALGRSVRIAAPTGKAAVRAQEISGLPAETIHRLVGAVRAQATSAKMLTDFLIVDETSMCDLETCAALLACVDTDRTQVLFVGDRDQLPSVGHGSVLSDMLSSGCIPQAHLDRVFRQAAGSRIVANAHALLDGKALELSRDPAADFLFADMTDPADPPLSAMQREQERGQRSILAVLRWLADRGADPAKDTQVLSPMRAGALGVESLNRLLQQELNPAGKLGPVIGGGIRARVGDRVIQLRNDYTLGQEGIFNGEMGYICRVDSRTERIWVDFGRETACLRDHQLYNIAPAWAVTVHRSQGSEFQNVILIYHTSHRYMLDRSLLYTAITRAKGRLVLVGTRRALELTSPRLTRYTGLVRQIQSACT